MSCWQYQHDVLHIENTSLKEIAEKYGTPCYVYSRTTIENNWLAFDRALHAMPHQICYAVKANSNIAILNILAHLGSGFDIVSQGELQRVIAAKGDPQKIIFSGVGKTAAEIKRAIALGVGCFNVESISELERLQEIAASQKKPIAIALRINPNIDPQTHAYISTGLQENKFGMNFDDVLPVCQTLKNSPYVRLTGIACHIGSQVTAMKPFLQSIDYLLNIYHTLKMQGISIEHINVGGGLGICYQNEKPPAIADYVSALQKKLQDYPLKIILEPGRAIVGNAGVLLTKIEYIKTTPDKNFAIVDAGMNDLLRPALYEAWHAILPVVIRHDINKEPYDIAGPVCESADFLGKQRKLAIAAEDLLAVCSAGAYGFSMSSNYNSRPRPAEILVHGKQAQIIRQRETLEELFAGERIL